MIIGLLCSVLLAMESRESYDFESSRNSNDKFQMKWSRCDLPPPILSIAKWKWEALGKTPSIPSSDQLTQIFPVQKPEWDNDADGISVTWIGHSTVYIRMSDGMSVLTDPLLFPTITPFGPFSPKRYVDVPFDITDMPKPNLILISHDHYDHLDEPSIKAIENMYTNDDDEDNPVYVVGLGLKEFMQSRFDIGSERIIELDWWQEHQYGSLTIRFLPAQHWSGRILDYMQRLWGGFLLTDSAHKKLYYTGDTGYDDTLFAEVAERIAPVDVALIPIGAYSPRWFMHPQHINPDEANVIHQMVGSRNSIAVHWGTFVLADEPLLEPKERLEAIRAEIDDGSRFLCLQHGQTITFN